MTTAPDTSVPDTSVTDTSLPETTLLQTTGLVAGYDGVPAVHGIDLHVGAGEIVALLGANGAGKTTTLMAIMGVQPVLSGSISILGRPRRTHAVHRIARQGVALVPDDRGIFFQLSVRDNLRLRRRRRSGVDIASAFEQFAALRPLADRKAALLSGGEQQMLALACALLSQPRLLLVDEMSHGLAPVIVAQLLPQLRVLAAEQGIGVLLVEQHVTAALDVADRGYILARGRVVAEGSAASLRDQLDVMEASYLGVENLDAVDDLEQVDALTQSRHENARSER